MSNFNNLKMWLEQGPEAPDMGPPTGDAMMNPMGMPPDPNAGNPPPGDDPAGQMPPDQSDEPIAPDMSDVSDESTDFETWRREYFDLAIKGDTNQMLDAISQVRDRDLGAADRRFVEDNFQILILRQDSNIDKASKEIRKKITDELDRNNPGVSVMQHITNTLEAYPMLNDIFIKLAGQGGFKGEGHRRFIAALIGGIQTGVGGFKPDLIYPARDYTIDLSTRLYTKYGDINIGKWTLREDDPDKYLSEPELERLQDGSPEEKKVLRRRICMESIATKYKMRAFLIHVVEPENGTIHAFAWDIAEGLRAGYKEGKLVVRKKQTEYREAMIDDNGAIIPLFAYTINYKSETGEMTNTGEAQSKDVDFMEQRDGVLYLTADPETIQELSGGMPGMWYQSLPYQGNPSDLVTIMRCVPSSVEMLMRRC